MTNQKNKKKEKSSKDYTTAVILSGIFGVIGIQHFYLGRRPMGVLDICLTIGGVGLIISGYGTIGTLFLIADGIHTIIVTYLLLVGEFEDGDGKTVTYPNQKI